MVVSLIPTSAYIHLIVRTRFLALRRLESACNSIRAFALANAKPKVSYAWDLGLGLTQGSLQFQSVSLVSGWRIEDNYFESTTRCMFIGGGRQNVVKNNT
eukprot:COSAG02_NODE_4790_length_4976_cov_2.574739_4_plen_100_part_00